MKDNPLVIVLFLVIAAPICYALAMIILWPFRFLLHLWADWPIKRAHKRQTRD
jgi:hypothetical protein